jgi:hypothetical protein
VPFCFCFCSAALRVEGPALENAQSTSQALHDALAEVR